MKSRRFHVRPIFVFLMSLDVTSFSIDVRMLREILIIGIAETDFFAVHGGLKLFGTFRTTFNYNVHLLNTTSPPPPPPPPPLLCLEDQKNCQTASVGTQEPRSHFLLKPISLHIIFISISYHLHIIFVSSSYHLHIIFISSSYHLHISIISSYNIRLATTAFKRILPPYSQKGLGCNIFKLQAYMKHQQKVKSTLLL